MKDFYGIFLMSIAAKVYNLLFNPFQGGFRKIRNCLEQIHVLSRVIEVYYQRQLLLKAVFIDFKKAFDSIDREIMWKILRNYRTLKKIAVKMPLQ